MSVNLILLVLALACFLADVVISRGRNLIALGLALWVLSLLLVGR